MADDPLFEKPLDDLIPKGPRPRRPETRDEPLPSLGRDTPREELLAIGYGQRALIRWVLIGLLCRFGGAVLVLGLGEPAPPLAVALVVLLSLAADAVAIVAFVRFASHLYPTVVVGVLVLCVLSCLGLLVVALVNVRATETLTRNGIRVGLLGARKADLARLDPNDRANRPGGNLPKLGW